jgi:O-antigen ligase
MISTKPLLGYGYHVQQTYLPTKELLSVGAFHNGYIGLVVEIGFLGAIPLFCLIGLAVFYLWPKARLSNEFAVELSFVIGYLVYSMAQPYLVNQTNPASALVWCILCGTLVADVRRDRGRLLPARVVDRFPDRSDALLLSKVTSGRSALRQPRN